MTNPSIKRTIYWRILYQNIFEDGGGGGNNISYLSVECSTQLYDVNCKGKLCIAFKIAK